MKRTITIGLAAMVLFAIFAGGASLAMAEEQEQDDELDELSVGEQLSGAMSAQEAELDGELDRHAFGNAIANAESDEERAALITERKEAVREDIDTQKADHEALQDAYEAGEVTRGEYVSDLSAQGVGIDNAHAAVDDMDEAANDLPTELREEAGVNSEALNTLREEAEELTGPEVAAIATTIAGPDVSDRIGGPDNGDAGPGDRAGGPDDGDDDEADADDGEDEDADNGDTEDTEAGPDTPE